MVYTQPRTCPGEWEAQTLLGFWDTNRSPNLGQINRPWNNKKTTTTKNLPNCGLCCPDWSKIERKRWVPGPCSGIKNTVEHERKDYTNWSCCFWYSYQRFGKRTGRLGNKRTIVRLFKLQQFKLQHFLNRAGYWEVSWRLEVTCCHSNSSERPSANADVKNSQGVK